MSRTANLVWAGSVLCVFCFALLPGCNAQDSAPSPAAERRGLEARIKVIDADLASIKSNTSMDANQKAAAVAQLEAQRAAAKGALDKIPATPVK